MLHTEHSTTNIRHETEKCYAVNVYIELDRTDLLIYEEVARMPPFQRKTLVLLGAKNVGRRTLKQRLVAADPSRFAGVVPCTLTLAFDLRHCYLWATVACAFHQAPYLSSLTFTPFFSFFLSFQSDRGYIGWSDNPQSALRPSCKVQPSALNPHVCYL